MTLRLGRLMTLGAAAMFALSGIALAQAPSSRPEGTVTIGAVFGDNTGTLNRVVEYGLAKSGTLPSLNAQIWGDTGTVRYELLASHGGDSRQQKYEARLSAAKGRIIANASFDRFLHRLDHDPLDYVESGVSTFVVRATDHDPTAAYSTTTGLWHADLTVAATDHLRLFASHSLHMSEGMRQSMTTSHCANCHIDSYSRTLDSKTHTVTAGARFSAGRFSADYTFEHRKMEERSATLLHTYDNAVHPSTLVDQFVNRVQYDDGNGPLPFDTVPTQTKRSNTLRASYTLPGSGAVSAGFTQSSSDNDGTGMGAEFVGVNGRAVIPLGKKAYVKAFFRKYEIETDSVFVDVAEPVAPAGPMAGLTYSQGYPGMLPLDFQTESTASRTPTELAIELAYRPSKKAALNVGFEYEDITRTEFMVEKSTTSTIKASGSYRFGKTLSARGRYVQAFTSDPYANLKAAKPAILQTVPTPNGVPFGPLSLQYFEMYNSRTADLSASPTDSLFLDGGLTWAPSQHLSVSAHYRYRNLENDGLNASTWSHAAHMPGVDLYYAPNDRLMLAAGWGYQKDTLDTVLSTLNFGG